MRIYHGTGSHSRSVRHKTVEIIFPDRLFIDILQLMVLCLMFYAARSLKPFLRSHNTARSIRCSGF